MKRNLFCGSILLLMLLAVGSVGFCQEYSGVLSVGSSFVSSGLEFEKVINPGMSLAGEGQYLSLKSNTWELKTYGGAVTLRKYKKQEAPKGFWYGGNLQYLSVSGESEIDAAKASGSFFGVGLLLGKKWIFGSDVTFEFSGGMSFVSGEIDVTGGSDADLPSLKGFIPQLGLRLGYAF